MICRLIGLVRFLAGTVREAREFRWEDDPLASPAETVAPAATQNWG